MSLIEQRHARYANDHSDETEAACQQKLDQALATFSASSQTYLAADARLQQLQRELVPRIGAECIAKEHDRIAGQQKALADFVTGTEPAVDAAERWYQLTVQPLFLAEAQKYVSNVLLPTARMEIFRARAENAQDRANAALAEADLRVVRKYQSARQLIESEGGTIELSASTGLTASALEQAAEAQRLADAALVEYQAELQRQSPSTQQ